MKTMKRILSLVLVLTLLTLALPTLASCGCGKNKKVSAKIGVIRGDASSVEALAWENYLKDLSAEMGVKINFSTAIESADQELQAVQSYGSQGYNGILAMTSYNPTTLLEKCEEYKMYLVIGAAHPDFEESENSISRDPNVIIRDYTPYPHYVGATGPSHYSEVLAGYEMGKAGVSAGFTKYSVFTGAAAYGQMMHALRIAGWFAALHDDDPSVSYGGVECTLANWKTVTERLQADFGVNLSKFSSNKYKILAQAGGYQFLQGDSTAKAAVSYLTSAPGVECVFCAGSSDAVSNLEPAGSSVKYIGNDSLGGTFESLFSSGKLIFDIAKYNSYLGPAFALLLKSIYQDSAVRIDGEPVSIEQASLSITQASDYTTIGGVENKTGGYFFSSEFLSAYLTEADIGENASGYTKITDDAFIRIAGGAATLGEGGLYETTRAVSEAYTAAGHSIFVFSEQETGNEHENAQAQANVK